jgi:hypothetical protein
VALIRPAVKPVSEAPETIRRAVARGFGGRPILVVGDLIDVYV